MKNRRLSKQRGATMIEYALIVGLIALAAIAGVTLVGGNLAATFNNAAGQLD